MFLLYRADGPVDGWLLHHFLDTLGIPSEVRGQSLYGLGGAIPMPDAAMSVWVAEPHRERAQAALKRWKGPELVHPRWRCSACGEENEPAFELCWSCGHDRDAG